MDIARHLEPAPEPDLFRVSRRRLLGALAALPLGALAAELSACSPGVAPMAGPAGDTAGGQASPGALASSDLAVLRRLSFGLAPDLLAQVRAAGDAAAWVQAQLTDPGPESEVATGIAASADALADSIDPAVDRNLARRRALEVLHLRTLGLAASSTRQVREVLTGIWSDHLHVTSSEQPEVFLCAGYDRMLRDKATSSFAELLVASARHPAMLHYLDNTTSRADGGRRPNENYARELLELHTVGVDGGYDEADVLAVSHVFSGWSAVGDTFAFRSARHRLGPAEGHGVLGWTPSGKGDADGVSLLNHLARHPATARRVVHRLARRLVGPHVTPFDPAVEAGVHAYLTNDTRIAPVVSALVAFAAKEPVVGGAIRTPQEYLAAILRSGRAAFDPVSATGDSAFGRFAHGALALLGHSPYGWPAPDGYPVDPGYWSGPGSMITRWNIAETLALSRRAGVTFAWRELPGGSAHPGELASAILGVAPSTALADTLQTAARAGASVEHLAVLVLGSPDFQLR